MNQKNRRIISISLGIALILGGFIGARLFVKTKPQAERRRQMSSMVPVVETAPFKQGINPVRIECLGTVIADQSVSILPEVSGRIVSAHPNLVEGEQVKKGDVLFEIESADYELALANAEASLLSAKATRRIEEGQQDVVRHEMDLMGTEETDTYRDLMLREPQLKSAEASVKSAELAVESAKLNLQRTKITAPFDAVVVRKYGDIGDYAQNSTLVELASTDRYFIRASVPLSSLKALSDIGARPYSARITLSDGSNREAVTHKLLPDLTETGRMARILLIVEEPFNSTGRPLLLNEYVRVDIEGNSVSGSTLLPRKYLRDGDVIWTIDADKKLQILPTEVLQGYADKVLVRIDGPAEMEVVTTDLSAAVKGMQLRREGDPAPAKKPREVNDTAGSQSHE